MPLCSGRSLRTASQPSKIMSSFHVSHEAVDDAPRPEEKWETDSRMIIDFLWSDPRGGFGYGPSYRKSRGVFMFGPDVTEQFCRENNVKLVIRSHEARRVVGSGDAGDWQR